MQKEEATFSERTFHTTSYVDPFLVFLHAERELGVGNTETWLVPGIDELHHLTWERCSAELAKVDSTLELHVKACPGSSGTVLSYLPRNSFVRALISALLVRRRQFDSSNMQILRRLYANYSQAMLLKPQVVQATCATCIIFSATRPSMPWRTTGVDYSSCVVILREFATQFSPAICAVAHIIVRAAITEGSIDMVLNDLEFTHNYVCDGTSYLSPFES